MGLGDFADKAKDAVDKGADKLNDATGGKFEDQIDKGREAAEERFGGGSAKSDETKDDKSSGHGGKAHEQHGHKK